MPKEIRAAPSMAKQHQDVRITATLISELKRRIASGAIAPGDRFPPEREMASTFRVNRASMRQALKVLESMGVLSQRVGDGTYLSHSAETLLAEPLEFLMLLDNLSPQDLADTSLIVEPELAARAAIRATGNDFAAMQTAIAAMEKSKTAKHRVAADLQFHDVLYRASGNRICSLLFGNLRRLHYRGPRHSAKAPESERCLIFYRRIYAAIKARNSQASREAMRESILDTMGSQQKTTQQVRERTGSAKGLRN